MNIKELLDHPNVTLSVTPEDLYAFALAIIDEKEKAKEKEKAQEKYLTSEEVQEMLGVTRPTLWRWRKDGYLIPLKVGAGLRYTQSQIDKFLKERNAQHEE